MTSKHINVNLGFTADTANAKQQIQTLQQQLNQLAIQPTGIGEKLTNEISQASHAAAELKLHLQNAINVNTGALDFSKLNQSIKKSGMTLTDYGAKLQSLGPKGQQAFMTLAQSVLQSEVAIKRSSTLLTGLGTTLMNTAKWQLSSTLLHGFIGSISKAYNYAQDLNESLNRIRIVTNHNIEYMSKFAEEANKAAKALSTTTTAYTDAALIYYQQGLNDQEVKARTEVTLKLANVTAQSAEIVSDQMTAIWNNFYDGGKSLEYYADVITALGAATASSTDEISQGLEKFAAVAETVGLSYEYATAALATVTATTRQSADVVGTAFKTLFARIQDLDLGKTLDDGTTLGSYSEALMKVGVNIKDTSGQLKDMDIILEEMAAKWDTLGQAEQVALAKSVAGVRQYTQLIALMDNWDFMERNLEVVEKSSGTLQNQADIYAESWEAAKKRVRAASEELYSSLFNDKVFIKITDGFGSIIETVGKFVKSIGGLGGVLSGLGLILTKVFSQQMTEGFRNLAHNIKMSTELGRYAEQQNKMKTVKNYAAMMRKEGSGTEYEIQNYEHQAIAQEKLLGVADKLTEEEKQRYQILMDQAKSYGEQSVALEKQAKQLQMMRQDKSDNVMTKAFNTKGADTKKIGRFQQDLIKKDGMASSYAAITTELKNMSAAGKISDESIKNINAHLEKLGLAGKDGFKSIMSSLKNTDMTAEEFLSTLSELRGQLNNAQKTKINEIVNLEDDTVEVRELKKALQEYFTIAIQCEETAQNATVANDNMKDSYKRVAIAAEDSAKRQKKTKQDWAASLTTITSGLMSAGMLISSFNSLVDTLKSPDTSGWEKFSSVLTSVAMISFSLTSTIQGVIALYKGFTSVIKGNTVVQLINLAASYLQNKAGKDNIQIKRKAVRTVQQHTKELNKNTASKVANAAADKITFKDKGKIRTYSGKRGKGGQLLDDDNNPITGKRAKNIKKQWKQQHPVGDSSKPSGQKFKIKNRTPKNTGKLNPGALKTVGSVALPLAIYAAAIAGFAFAISKASDMMNQHEMEVAKAEKTAKELGEQYEATKEKVSTFKDTLSNYRSGVDGLKDLTKGTIEYKEAVFEANEAALELIKNNKDLKYEMNADGLIEFDPNSLRKVQEDNLQKLKSAQAASIQGQIDLDNARIKADITNFNREYADSSTSDSGNVEDRAAGVAGLGGVGLAAGGAAGAGTAIALGAASVSWIPIVGWVIAAIGGVAAIVAAAYAGFNNDETESEKQALEDLQKEVQLNGNGVYSQNEMREFLEKQGKYDEDLIDSLVENSDEVQKLVEKMIENTEATYNNTKAILGQYYENPEVAGAATGEYEKQKEEAEKKWSEVKEGVDRWSDYGDESVTKLLDAYNKYTGNNYEWASNTVQKNDNGDLVVYIKDPNEESGEKMLASLDAIYSAVVSQEAVENTAPIIKDLEKSLAKVNAHFGKGIENMISSFIDKQNIGTLMTTEEFDEFKKLILGDDGVADNEEVSKALEEIFGYSSKQLAQMISLYKGSENKLVDDLVTSITTTEDDIEKIFTGSNNKEYNSIMNSLFRETFDKLDINIDNQKKLGNTLLSVYNTSGESGMKSVNSLLNSMTLTGAEKNDFISQFLALDWNNMDVSQLTSFLHGFDSSLNMSETSLLTLISVMQQKGTPSIEEMSASIKKMSDTVKSLKTGDVISATDYLELSAQGLSSYFSIMYDGTYKLVKTAYELQAAFKSNTLNTLNTSLEDAQATRQSLQADYANKLELQNTYDLETFTADYLKDTNVAALYTEGSWTDKDYGGKQWMPVSSEYVQKDNGEWVRKTEWYGKEEYDAVKAVFDGARKEEEFGSDNYGHTLSSSVLTPRVVGEDFFDMLVKHGIYDESEKSQWFETSDSVSSTIMGGSTTVDSLKNESTQLAEAYIRSEYSSNKDNVTNRYQNYKNNIIKDGQFVTFVGSTGDFAERLTPEEYTERMFMQTSELSVNDAAIQFDTALSLINAMGTAGESGADWTVEYLINNWATNENLRTEFIKAYQSAQKDLVGVEEELRVAMEEEYKIQVQMGSVAQSYEELLEIAEDYSLDPATVTEVAQMLDATRESLNLNSEEVATYTEYLLENNSALADNEGLAAKSAQATMRLNDAVDSIQKNFVDWMDNLGKFKQGSEQFVQTVNQMKTAYADLLGTSEEFLSDAFILDTKNLQLLSDAANGSVEAFEQLSHNAAIDYLVSLNLDTDSASKIEEFLETEQGHIDDLTVGIELNDEQFIADLNTMIAQGKITIEEVEEMLNMRGLTLDFEEVGEGDGFKLPKSYFDVDDAPVTEIETNSEVGGVSYTLTVPENLLTEGGDIEMTPKPGPSADKKDHSIVPGRIKSITKYSMKAPSSSGGAGLSVKSSKAASQAKKDKGTIERYKEITDAIDDVKHAADQAAKAADRLWGGARISALKEQNKQIEKQIDLIKQEKAQAQQYLEQDKNNLNTAASNLGLEVSYGENGNIINATQLREQAYDEYNKYVDSVYSDGVVSEQESFVMDNKKTYLDNFDKYLKQYDETKEKIEDLDDEMDEAFYQWQDNNFEIWQEELELKISIDTRSLETAQYYFDKLSESFYTQAEAMGYLTSQINITQNQYDDFYSSVEDLDKAFADNDISQAKYVEGLEQMRDKALENAKSLQELDKQMMDYYGNTLKMGQTEISKYTDLMDNSSSVLDHYSSILKLVGKENDHEAMSQILESQAHTAKNEAIAAKESYDMFRAQADKAKSEYEKAKSDPNVTKEQLEILEKAWVDAEGVAAEEQEKMLTATENWAQKMQDVYDNDLAKFAKDLEESLTGGTSYDWMKTSVERAQSSQEEYLTTTNKIYETNKMINEAQKKIDETTNTAAKKRLQAFQEETKQKQQQGKLSQFELDIQQAKYDLLLAEIALEEAQNAKSTVTLQRDAEGNYGYVYTADSDEVANAQQAVDDADNALYNVRLEGANNYTQKMTDLTTEMGEALSNIRREDYDSEEEWQAALDATRQYYFKKMEDYSNLYGVAVAEDGRVTEDAWSTAFSTMMTNTDTWQQNVNKYLNNVKETVENYYNDKENGLPAVLDLLGLKFEAVKSSVSPLDQAMGLLNGTSSTTYFRIQGLDTVTQNAKKSSDDYLKILTGDDGIIKKTEEEATKVYNKTLEYSTWRAEVVNDIKEYEKLYEWLTKKIDDQVITYDYEWEENKPSEADVSQNGKVYYTADYSNLQSPPSMYADVLTTSTSSRYVDAEGIGYQAVARYVNSQNGEVTDSDLDTHYLMAESKVKAGTANFWDKAFYYDYEIGKIYNDFVQALSALGYNYNNEQHRILIGEKWYSITNGGPEHSDKDSIKDYIIELFGKNILLRHHGLADELTDLIVKYFEKTGTSYDTGGYTGTWGQAGKLAVLHEKEIVLNKEDTKNFLDAISILRSTNSITLDNILQQIENQIIQMSLTYTDLVNSLRFEKEKDVLQQEVSINVEFPNVTSSDEIERAFENIVNEAAQYAYRR